ncbi:MAG: DUF4188 domain-containing protein [Vicinamibacterales bacterium]
MAEVVAKRVTAKIDGDFVVFLIGMRINKPWKINKWLPVFLAMPKMIRELEARPESGFLGHVQSLTLIVQYWRSFEHLEAYARDHDQLHWPAWVDFNTRVGSSRGDVGIWHETYRVRAGEYECVYSGMPPFGLAKASTTVDAVGHLDTARKRIGGTAAASAESGA